MTNKIIQNQDGVEAAHDKYWIAIAYGPEKWASSDRDSSQAHAFGDWGGAHADGKRGVAKAYGKFSRARAYGKHGRAEAHGKYGLAIAAGEDSEAIAYSDHGQVKGMLAGCQLSIINSAKTRIFREIVGVNGIKPKTWYGLEDGKFVEMGAQFQ